MFTDFLHVADLRLAGLGHNMHACIFNHIGDVFPYRFFGVRIQKLPIGVIHHGHIAVFVDHDNTVENTVDDRIQRALQIFDLFEFRGNFLQFGDILKNRHSADNFIVFYNRRPFGNDLRIAELNFLVQLNHAGLQNIHESGGVRHHIVDGTPHDIFRLHAGDHLGRRIENGHDAGRIDGHDAIACRVQNSFEFFGHGKGFLRKIPYQIRTRDESDRLIVRIDHRKAAVFEDQVVLLQFLHQHRILETEYIGSHHVADPLGRDIVLLGNGLDQMRFRQEADQHAVIIRHRRSVDVVLEKNLGGIRQKHPGIQCNQLPAHQITDFQWNPSPSLTVSA